jgi:hypothetical protein
MSGDIPVGVKELEEIITKVANDLLEEWAINDRFTEEDKMKYAQYAVDDTVFVINGYMEIFNELIALSQGKKLIQ